MADSTGRLESCISSFLNNRSDMREVKCIKCEEVSLELLQANTEILSLEKIIKMLQEQQNMNMTTSINELNGADEGGYATTSARSFNDNVRIEKFNHRQDDVSNELKGVKSYMMNLNQRLKQAVGQPMEEVIEMEVNTILTKIESLCEIMNDQTYSESKWTNIKTKKQKGTTNNRHENIYNIPVINNRYELQVSKDASKIQTLNSAKNKMTRNYNTKVIPTKKKTHRILIIGDSHGRGCADEMMHNLNSDFEVQGIIKPGADLATITGTAKREVKLLTKKDVIIIWGGVRDVGKNETMGGLNQLKGFFKENKHTNIIQMGIPHRFDLHENSCVNKEIEVFNRKLGKLIKAFDHTTLIQPDSNREIFTRHGLHMNRKGKELTAMKIRSAIRHLLDKKIGELVVMTWKEEEKEEEDRETTLQGKHNLNKGKVEIQDFSMSQKGKDQEPKQDVTNTVSTRRLRKPPIEKRDDFLGMDKKRRKFPTTKEKDLVS
ncbi:hypothetical protein B7P43_G12843 [Cryptotermes secundus]|uniref:Uncharacterized protein n=1 Tax=Cryptotermes secundus TaxID=105785 RepID=A0A2J7Q5Q3_9NEOP|nr:hypothetical protein B7P43_G12843 [Cryptotermes secundus]